MMWALSLSLASGVVRPRRGRGRRNKGEPGMQTLIISCESQRLIFSPLFDWLLPLKTTRQVIAMKRTCSTFWQCHGFIIWPLLQLNEKKCSCWIHITLETKSKWCVSFKHLYMPSPQRDQLSFLKMWCHVLIQTLRKQELCEGTCRARL
jgi:hypothetical protein